MSSGGGSSALTGITTFLVLAFLLPGIVYVAAIAVIFDPGDLETFVPRIELRLDVAAGAVVVLGLLITSVVFALEIGVRVLWSLVVRRQWPNFGAYVDVIFRADRRQELAWYFWQVWGQRIMHLNVFGGLVIIYVVYRWSIGNFVEWSWKDIAVGVAIASNCMLYLLFSAWHEGMMQQLRNELTNPPPTEGPA